MSVERDADREREERDADREREEREAALAAVDDAEARARALSSGPPVTLGQMFEQHRRERGLPPVQYGPVPEREEDQTATARRTAKRRAGQAVQRVRRAIRAHAERERAAEAART